jgi:hypothetical protein
MPNPSLYTRSKLPIEKGGHTRLLWRYQRVKEGRGVKTANLTGPFYSHGKTDGRTVWSKLLHDTVAEAKAEAREKLVANKVVPIETKPEAKTSR